MGKLFSSLEPQHIAFIERQHIFFNASAAPTGRVNVSPRDRKSLRVLDPHTALYYDLTGSGNETAAHLRADGRLTLMFCALEGPPLILRLYGRGRVIPRGSEEFATLLAAHFDNTELPGTRQMIALAIDSVQTSCGFNVPLFDYQEERDTLLRWSENKGPDGLQTYWRQKNLQSIDGLPTGLLTDVPTPSAPDNTSPSS